MRTLLNGVTLGLVLVAPAGLLFGQGAPAQLTSGPLPPSSPASQQPGPVITVDEALKRAQANEPNFAQAVAAAKSASLDRSIARAALLPQVNYHNQFLYTQPNGGFAGLPNGTARPTSAASPGLQSVPRFVANNAVHEYTSQAVVTETLGFGSATAVTRAGAAEAIAKAELELSRRGLTSTVLTLYFAVQSTLQKADVARRAQAEAQDFVKNTSEREAEREVAHADVIKAQLAEQQRRREVEDTTLEAERARLELGVLLFADPRTPYSVTPPMEYPLPTRDEIEMAARTNNPELRSALSTLAAGNLDVRAARQAYLPDLALGYNYGIDAPQFNVNGPAYLDAPGRPRNLGYSAVATLDIPVFDWFATRDRVRQAELARDVAKVQLSAAQRGLIANLEIYYGEAGVAERQRKSLAESAATAAESLRLTRLRYAAGEGTVLEVVDAQNSLLLADLARVDGDTRYEAALGNLQLLTGAF